MYFKGFCVLIVLLGLVIGSQAGYNYDYLSENCNDNVTLYERDLTKALSTYGFVRPVRQGGYPRGMNCTLRLKAPPGHYLVVKFRNIEIYQNGNCRDNDYLLVSGNTSKYYYCGYRVPSHSLISTSDTINIRFVSTKHIDDNHRKGFDIYYTAFHRGNCDTAGSHPREFNCWSGGRCIPSELVCDSLDNCGDWSDERSKTCGLSTGLTICLSIVGVLVGGTCCIALAMWMCAKKKERSARARRAQEPVVQVEYTRGNQPPSYAGPNDNLGEKPPLPSYDNFAYSADLTPSEFMGPPSYESIAPPVGNQVAPMNVANPTYGSQASESVPARNQVAPESNVANGQAEVPLPASNQMAPLPTIASGRVQESTPASNQVAPELTPVAASGNQMAPESTATDGMYEDVDLSTNDDPYDYIDGNTQSQNGDNA